MIAVDTNILVYAVDANEQTKGAIAAALIERLAAENAVLLYQVVAEFGAVFDRKRRKTQLGIDVPALLEGWFDLFKVVTPSTDVVTRAWRLLESHQLQYWDAVLIAGCIEAGVTRLYTEDLQDRPQIEGVQIVNPFA